MRLLILRRRKDKTMFVAVDMILRMVANKFITMVRPNSKETWMQ